MEHNYINLTAENLAEEHLCCIIRTKKPHPGVEKKRQWLADRLKEGHVFRKLDVKNCVFIEYAPLEAAWVPIVGDNYMYIYCLWVSNTSCKGCGYGTELMNDCLEDARRQGKSGVCMLGANKQKAWLSDQSFAKRFGFQTVDSTAYGYELLARSFDGTKPSFTQEANAGRIETKNLTVYYDFQCPIILQRIEKLKEYCQDKGITLSCIEVTSRREAKELPGVFNNWAVFYDGVFQTVNQLDGSAVERLLKSHNL